MTRQEQNGIILNSLTERLRDLPNIQEIITSKFDAWFRKLVEEGSAMLQPVTQEAPPQKQGQEAAIPAAPEGVSA